MAWAEMISNRSGGRFARYFALVLAVGVLSASLPASVSASVSASPYGAEFNGPGYYPDSLDHWYCFDGSVPAGDYVYRQWAMANMDAQTAGYDVAASGCGSATDIRFFEANPIPWHGSGTVGWAPCAYFLIYLACDQSWVYTNFTAIWVFGGGLGGDPNLITYWFHFTTRHEIGHTLGLGHSDGTHALHTPLADVNLASAWLYYQYHDVCHYNLYFSQGC